MIYHDDCLNILPTIADKSIDMVFGDPPYDADKTRASWDNLIPIGPLWEQLNRIVKSNGAVVITGQEPFSSSIRMSNIDNYKYDWKWVKNIQTGFANSAYRPMNKYEDVMIFSMANASAGGRKNAMVYNPQGLIEINKVKKNSDKRHGLVQKETNNVGSKNALMQDGSEYLQKYTGYPSNILEFSSENVRVHPTQKPVSLIEYLILTYTNEGDTVLDFCMGSGTTGVACKNTGRKFIGIEKDEKYFNISKQRIEESE
jgi:site-specific DNA-methyltransferase (adenine-specific)